MAIKLSNIVKAKTTAVPVEIKHPLTGEVLMDEASGEKVIAWVYGRASKQYQDFQDKNLQEVLTKRKSGRNIDPIKDMTVSKVRESELDFPVAMTEKITGLETDDGEKFDNPDMIRALYEDQQAYYILEQVQAALNDDANFM